MDKEIKIKKGDFIEISYLAKVHDTNLVFDLTDEEDAKTHGLYDKSRTYQPIIICVGKNDILKGLDEELPGKEPGKSYTITLQPEQAFGKKTSNMIKLVPTSLFHKQQINPVPGLQVNLDNIIGTIKSVSGGRTIVDFNHPLSSKIILYEIKILRIITSPKEKLEGFLAHVITKYEVTIENEKAIISSNIKEAHIKQELEKEILSRIPEIISISFEKLPEKVSSEHNK
ncbi:MAG TPA: peptidylprolyl isomerase [Candidatus Nanoarchaeia archaeon]|nr:peptidylprolyl isomerase [Candidatus Nanoarchaeia archaeon]